MSKYEFFIAGRWRNRDNIMPILDLVRGMGHTAYCFIENEYKDERIDIGAGDPNVFMTQTEAMDQNDPLIRQVFQVDIEAERESDKFLLVLPAGIASHIEAGVAYGMGKKCYAIGQLEKTETLYCIFDHVFPDAAALESWLNL